MTPTKFAAALLSGALAGLLAGTDATAGAPRFYQGVQFGPDAMELKVADALHRDDGRWLTLGSQVSMLDNSEAPYVFLRDGDGTQVAAVMLAADGTLSYQPQSLTAVGDGAVVVLSVEYDHQDFSAYRGLLLTRLDADLAVVWSRRLRLPEASFEWARLKARACETCGPAGIELLLHGELQREVDGTLDSGDGLLARVDPADGGVSDLRLFGTEAGHERIVDVVPDGAGGRVLLLETSRRTGPVTIESGDGLIALDAAGTIAGTRLIGHTIAGGVRARALALMPHPDGGFVIGGRRTAFGPNFFYLHRVGVDLAPAAARTLIPFFNVADMAADAGGFWLYGEANGEASETGTVLMRFDGALNMTLQRRYATDNHVFPTGAIALAPAGALLALGADRSDEEVFLYEAVHRVDLPSGEGLLCEEGDYDGFTPASDTPTELAGWLPSAQTLTLAAASATVAAQPLTRSDVSVCAVEDDLIFASGFDF